MYTYGSDSFPIRKLALKNLWVDQSYHGDHYVSDRKRYRRQIHKHVPE